MGHIQKNLSCPRASTTLRVPVFNHWQARDCSQQPSIWCCSAQWYPYYYYYWHTCHMNVQCMDIFFEQLIFSAENRLACCSKVLCQWNYMSNAVILYPCNNGPHYILFPGLMAGCKKKKRATGRNWLPMIWSMMTHLHGTVGIKCRTSDSNQDVWGLVKLWDKGRLVIERIWDDIKSGRKEKDSGPHW